MLHFELFQGINEKAKYVGKLLFSPTRYDWQLYPVPANLSFGLRFLRPLRLLTECIVNLPKNLLKLKS